MFLFAVFFAVALATAITLTPVVVSLLTGTVIPVLVGAVTKSGASRRLKQAVTLVLSGIAALIFAGVTGDGSSVFTLETVAYAAMSWASSIAIYNDVYKRLDLNEKLAPERGLGVIDTTAVERIQ